MGARDGAPGRRRRGGFRLKGEDGGDLQLVGSSQLARTLVGAGLVDVFWLMVDPLVLGGGKRFLPDDGAKRELRLVDSQVATTGALLLTYETV